MFSPFELHQSNSYILWVFIDVSCGGMILQGKHIKLYKTFSKRTIPQQWDSWTQVAFHSKTKTNTNSIFKLHYLYNDNNNGVYLYCACTNTARAPNPFLQWQQLIGTGVTKINWTVKETPIKSEQKHTHTCDHEYVNDTI